MPKQVNKLTTLVKVMRKQLHLLQMQSRPMVVNVCQTDLPKLQSRCLKDRMAR
jgi:uncharacterized membrane protein (DUF106 family)